MVSSKGYGPSSPFIGRDDPFRGSVAQVVPVLDYLEYRTGRPCRSGCRPLPSILGLDFGARVSYQGLYGVIEVLAPVVLRLEVAQSEIPVAVSQYWPPMMRSTGSLEPMSASVLSSVFQFGGAQ